MFRQVLSRRALFSRHFATEKAASGVGTTQNSVAVSSVPAGTVLKGCNVRKNGEDPAAMEDSEYPDWLWEVLDPEAQKAKLQADPMKAARKARRQANREKIKKHNFLAKMVG